MVSGLQRSETIETTLRTYTPLAPPHSAPNSSSLSDDPNSPEYQQYLRSISLDAVNKVNHFTKCGRATAHVKPNVSVFYNDEGQAEIEQRVRDKTFTLQETMRGTAIYEPSCSASVRCSRPDSMHSNTATDITGMLGGVCTHSVPLPGSFLDMLTHENFTYYLILLEHIVSQVKEQEKASLA